MVEHISKYWKFYGDVVDALEERIDVDRSDAQGIVDAQEKIVLHSLNNGVSAKETAKLIDEASIVKR